MLQRVKTFSNYLTKNINYKMMDEIKNFEANGNTKPSFKISDYDCIGFDLDDTLSRYKIKNLVDLVYELLAYHLVSNYGYSGAHLLKPVDYSFLMRGLILDTERGNILKMNPKGKVLRASHGLRILSKEEILKYCPNQLWPLGEKFANNPIDLWNGPESNQLRAVLDNHDMPVSLVFARAVDSIDELCGEPDKYNIWRHIEEGLVHIYSREHYQINEGGFFPAVKSYPNYYYEKCSRTLRNWLCSLKQNRKILFLVTGSYVDFATHTLWNTIRLEFQQFFDITVCFAKKPGFFTTRRDFVAINDFKETGRVSAENLKFGEVYTYGNWDDLHDFFASQLKKPNPKCLYFGDNLVQDIFAASAYGNCDTVSVCEELKGESSVENIPFIKSDIWGSYFTDENNETTVWDQIVRNHSKECIDSLEYIANFPLDHAH